MLANPEAYASAAPAAAAPAAPAAEETKAEEKKEETTTTTKRMSMRTRTVPTPELPTYRCLQWQNSMALDDLGHLHSDQPPPPPPQSSPLRGHDLVISFS